MYVVYVYFNGILSLLLQLHILPLSVYVDVSYLQLFS